MSLFQTIDTAATGLTAERLRMDVISDNLANVNTTRSEDGGPYRRKVVTFQPRDEGASAFPSLALGDMSTMDVGQGVQVAGIEEAEGEFRHVHDPEHPDANEEGYVLKPNIDPAKEMVDMITATRAYEANVSSIESAKKMFNEALNIAR